MRKLQPFIFDNAVTMQQQVEIDAAGAPPLFTAAIERVFDCRQHCQKVFRLKIGFNQAGRVEVSGLSWWATDWPCFNKLADLQQRNAWHEPKHVDRLIELFAWAAKVRAAPNQGPDRSFSSGSNSSHADSRSIWQPTSRPPTHRIAWRLNRPSASQPTVTFHRSDVLPSVTCPSLRHHLTDKPAH